MYVPSNAQLKGNFIKKGGKPFFFVVERGWKIWIMDKSVLYKNIE